MTDTNTREPYLIIMSDTHVSSPDGRWSHVTARFHSFLEGLKADPPEVLFINGDIVDNVFLDDGKPVLGGLEHWEKDVHAYCSAIAPYKEIDFRGSLGPNHDFLGDISMAHAGERLCTSRGSFAWQGFNFVWLSGKMHSFSNDPELREESFETDDLVWLDHELDGKDNVVLMFHVPLTTEDTVKRGAWPDNRSIIIPTEDRIYDVIDRHLDSIKMIFNGHIHGLMESDYKGIPLKIAAFYDQGHYCRVTIQDRELNVTLHSHPSPAS